ncbi:MAG: RNA polymerase subunit sigma [Prevotella sp.]|jgi:DNA-directed RNA polymerase sigma subunit (sigma70/sigma32)
MDAFAKQIHNYLKLMKESVLLVSERDKANIDILITMLGELDKEIICERYGLFGVPQKTLADIAEKHHVKPEVIAEIVEKDLRKIAITPEWQMMIQDFSPTVKQKIGIA